MMYCVPAWEPTRVKLAAVLDEFEEGWQVRVVCRTIAGFARFDGLLVTDHSVLT
jgi:hypothetical protein